jgi:hypothetical protein
LGGRPDQAKATVAEQMGKAPDEDALARRRAAASIVVLDADRLAEEMAAFDVLVNLDYAGHWAETNAGRAAMTWVGGEVEETESCEGDEEKVKAVIRPLIPASRLEPEKPTPPKYDVGVVEAVILQVAAELAPEHVSTGALLLKVVGDADDAREIETGAQAVRSLREVGLFTYRDDEIVEPTPAAVRAVELLT